MEKQKDSIYSNIPFRVRVGVIGAAHLFDKTRLANQINQIFTDKIRGLYDENSQKKIEQAEHTKLAFSVLTMLGNKTERFAAGEISKQSNGKIEIVLPCAKTAFLREFVEPSEHHEFEELFNRARRPIAMHKHLSSSKWTAAEREKNQREMMLETWRYIVNRTDVLVVIRDEKLDDENIKNIIGYAENKQRPVILIAPDGISAERGHGLNADAIEGLEAFNSFRISPNEQKAYIENAYGELFENTAGIEESSKQLVRKYLLPFYARASMIAKKNQTIYQRAGLLVYSFSAMAVGAVALGTLVHKLSPWAFGLEFLLLLTILVTVFWANRKRRHRKWIENRFLTERLRAARFLAACETEVTPIKVPPYLGTKGQSDDWMLMVFDEIWQRLPALRGCSVGQIENLKNFIRVCWLEDQIKYHEKKTRDAHRLSHLLEWSGIVIFSLALLAAALHLIFYLLHHEWLEAPLTFAAIVLPAVGAAIGGIRAHREYSRISKRSENLVQNMAQLKERIENVTEPDEFETFLREIEETMLVETQDWLMLMRFAKLETAA